MAQPALPQPLSVWSLNRSKTQRNQMKMAEIQMKIQKLQRRTSQKLLMLLVLIFVSHLSGGGGDGEGSAGGAGGGRGAPERPAGRHPLASWSMQTVIARMSASFCPGATSTP